MKSNRIDDRNVSGGFGLVGPIALAVCVWLLGGSVCVAQPAGVWLMPRKDAANTARCDVPGDMVAPPRVVWRGGGDDRMPTFVRQIGDDYLVHIRRGLMRVRPDGTIVWQDRAAGVRLVETIADFDGDGTLEAAVILGMARVALISMDTGERLWEWSLPAGGYLFQTSVVTGPRGARLVVFPVNTALGFCFDFSGSVREPKLLWRRDYNGRYHKNYGPMLAVADMDNDGRDDIILASKPPYTAVIDADTGQIKFDLQYPVDGPAGRPYGLMQVIDLDGDGFRDMVMLSSNVEEYLAVLRNKGGKAFELAWSHWVEKDWPDDEKMIQTNLSSMADVTGDGRAEIVLSLFNDTGDGRWHTLVIDPMHGWDARVADFPDFFFWGVHDLDGDGRAEIIVSHESDRAPTLSSRLQVIDGRTLAVRAELPGAFESRLEGTITPRPDDRIFAGIRPAAIALRQPSGGSALLVRPENDPDRTYLWRLTHDAASLEPFDPTPLARQLMMSDPTPPLLEPDLRIPGLESDTEPGALMALVCEHDGQRELVIARSDGTIVGGAPDLQAGRGFKDGWSMRGTMPSLWQGGDGRRIVFAVDPGKDRLIIAEPRGGGEVADALSVRLPYPAYGFNDGYGDTRDMNIHVMNALLTFGDEPRVFVPMQKTEMTYACGVFDDQGQSNWVLDSTGPYPRLATVADLYGDDRLSVVIDDHGNRFFVDDHGVARQLPRGSTSYALPIAGPFGGDKQMRVLMTPGLRALEVLDEQGELCGKHDYPDTYDYGVTKAAVARLRSDDAPWGCGIISRDGRFLCFNADNAELRWTIEFNTPGNMPMNITAGDIDGDGRDNFLVGLPTGELVAIDEKAGRGVVLWKLDLDAIIYENILADVDGDGAAEIVAITDDGYVRILE